MSAEYTSNHYVPQWYQRRFIPADATDRELYLLDLKPGSFRDARGVRHRRKNLRRTGTRKCFAVDDLYTLHFGDRKSRELERVFFGEIDRRGKDAVEFFSEFDHDGADGDSLQNLMLFMSTQKLRTPKGLDWLANQVRARRRDDALKSLTHLRSLYGAIWTEAVWQLADACESDTKFIVSDHPVTVYNRSCAPGNPLWCKGPNDPDVRLHGTHTLFPLSAERILILTNRLWACDPRRRPLEPRANPDLFRGAFFNFLDIQTGRHLSEQDVLRINSVIKRRAYRYVAAGRAEWLYPERHARCGWREIGDDFLLMPDPRSLHPGSEMTIGYASGAMEAMDSQGRLPGDTEFGLEAKSVTEIEAHTNWCRDFERKFGSARRGASWEDRGPRQAA